MQNTSLNNKLAVLNEINPNHYYSNIYSKVSVNEFAYKKSSNHIILEAISHALYLRTVQNSEPSSCLTLLKLCSTCKYLDEFIKMHFMPNIILYCLETLEKPAIYYIFKALQNPNCVRQEFSDISVETVEKALYNPFESIDYNDYIILLFIVNYSSFFKDIRSELSFDIWLQFTKKSKLPESAILLINFRYELIEQLINNGFTTINPKTQLSILQSIIGHLGKNIKIKKSLEIFFKSSNSLISPECVEYICNLNFKYNKLKPVFKFLLQNNLLVLDSKKGNLLVDNFLKEYTSCSTYLQPLQILLDSNVLDNYKNFHDSIWEFIFIKNFEFFNAKYVNVIKSVTEKNIIHYNSDTFQKLLNKMSSEFAKGRIENYYFFDFEARITVYLSFINMLIEKESICNLLQETSENCDCLKNLIQNILIYYHIPKNGNIKLEIDQNIRDTYEKVFKI